MRRRLIRNTIRAPSNFERSITRFHDPTARGKVWFGHVTRYPVSLHRWHYLSGVKKDAVTVKESHASSHSAFQAGLGSDSFWERSVTHMMQ